MKAWQWTAVAVLLVAGLSYAAYVALRPAPLPSGLLYGNGYIEGTEVAVSAEVGGRVVRSRLVEGETIPEGALLVRLDDAEPRARLAQMQAEAQALAKTKQRLVRELETARHHRETARADLERFRELRGQGSVTPQQLSRAEDRFEEARARVRALELQRDETGARQEAARQQVEVLRLQLARTRIRAPISGAVMTKAIEPGELASPGRVIAVLMDLSRLEIRVFAPVADVGKIRLGADARLRVDAYPERLFLATVQRVDEQAQFTPRDIHLPEERVRMVFGVTLAVDNPGGELKPGMPADVWIRWNEDVPWPERLTVPQ